MEAHVVERLRAVIRDMEALSLPRTLLTHSHRTYTNAVLGRDLILVVAKAEKGLSGAIHAVVVEVLGSGITGTGGGDAKKAPTKAGKFLETLQVFFQMCLQAEVMVCVNSAEKMFIADCFYVFLEKDASLDESKQGAGVRRMLELLQQMKSSGAVEVKDRRNGWRGFSDCFVREEALKWLQDSGCPDADAFLTRSLQEGLLVSLFKANGVEWLQFVPSVVHSGFAYVGDVGTWVRRWLVLREASLLVFNENRKQQVSEVQLTRASVDRVVADGRHNITELARDQYAFYLTTPAERVMIMMNSLSECDLWVEYILPLNAMVHEENELIQQAEAIICSTTYHANVL